MNEGMGDRNTRSINYSPKDIPGHSQAMTNQERSLLLYLEARAVDNNGLIDNRNMNAEDFETAKRWAKEGFIKFGRLTIAEIKSQQNEWIRYRTHFIRMTDESFRAAHVERRARSRRMIKKWEAIYFRPEKLDKSERHEYPKNPKPTCQDCGGSGTNEFDLHDCVKCGGVG